MAGYSYTNNPKSGGKLAKALDFNETILKANIENNARINKFQYPIDDWNGSAFATAIFPCYDVTGTHTLTRDTGVEDALAAGSSSMKYVTGTTGYKYWYFNLPVLSSGNYRFSYWAKLSSGSSNLGIGSIWRDVAIADRTPTGDWNPTYTTTWTRYVCYAYVTTALQLFLMHSGSLTGGYTLYLSDFQFESTASALDTYAQVTAGNKINVSEINALRTATVNLVKYQASTTFSWSETLTAGIKIKARHIEEIRQVVDDSKENQRCGTGCTTACGRGCTVACASSCSTSCSAADCNNVCGINICTGTCAYNTCTSTCQWLCNSACGNACTSVCSGCAQSCGGWCDGACAAACDFECSECSSTCGDACEGCLNACQATCSSTCGSYCAAGCGMGCSTTCSNACTSSCGFTCQTSTCTGACDAKCGGGCFQGCGTVCGTSYCGSNCSATCNVNCDAVCTGTCYSACTTFCGTTCNTTARLGTPPSCNSGCTSTCISGCSAICKAGAQGSTLD